jgi:Zn-dependent protease with chaperone function
MDAYKGNYKVDGYEEQEATISFLKDKLNIGITDGHNNPKTVYWFYDKINREIIFDDGNSIVRHEGYPRQSIEIPGREFGRQLEEHFRKTDKSIRRKLFSHGSLTLMKLLFSFFVLVTLCYFFLIPWLAVRLANKVPVSYEEKMGNSMFDVLSNSMKTDPGKTAIINEFFTELHVPTKYNIRISVVKDNVANAFAMPGGRIVVYDRLLNGMNSYEELAALLSHEFTHVNNKHTTKSLFRQLGSTVFFSVILGDVGAIGNVIVSNADRLKGLSYGRGLEKEADLNGLQILSERKIDCNGFIKLFELLQKEVNASGIKEPVEWISSHPDLQKRIDYIKSNELFNLRGVEKNETLQTLFLKLKTAG